MICMFITGCLLCVFAVVNVLIRIVIENSPLQQGEDDFLHKTNSSGAH